jgi:hypothetical protein
MSGRLTQGSFPTAPTSWDASSREAWGRLIQMLEQSSIFDKGRRSRPQFVVLGTVSAPLTLDVNNPEVTALTNVVAKLLVALEGSNFVDIRR